MAVPHMTNGQKASAVAAIGGVSLAGVIALAIFDIVWPSEKPSSLLTAAFTFLCGSVTSAMSYLMGASRPDETTNREPLPPGAARVTRSVTSVVAAEPPPVTGERTCTACGAPVPVDAAKCPGCGADLPAP